MLLYVMKTEKIFRGTGNILRYEEGEEDILVKNERKT